MKKEGAYNEILNWLDSDRNIKKGIKIHSKYSKNYQRKKKLAFYPVLRKKLLPLFLNDLLKSYKPKDVIIKKKKKKKAPKEIYTPNLLSKLKKEFPKIVFTELPETLKKLVPVRYQAWEDSIKYYALQHAADNEIDRFNAAKSTILSIQTNWLIWDELNHWHINRKILGKHPKFKEDEFLDQIKELKSKSEVEYFNEITKIRAKARNNILRMIRKHDNFTTSQQNIVDFWIFKHNIVSEILKQPIWKN